MTQKHLKVYAAGGCAINIMQSFDRNGAIGNKTDGFAQIDVAYIDSSKSNLLNTKTADYYHLSLPDGALTDGGGKVRKTVYQAALNAMPDILTQHKPADLNIVLHSAGGGSGGVIGYLIVKELLARGESVIAIIVESTTCVKELENCLATIESYRNAAADVGRPVNAIWHSNAAGGMRQVDNRVHLDILLLSAIWSGENHGLDSQDLIHFLDYNKVTTYKPSFSRLSTVVGKEQALAFPAGQAVSALLSLVRQDDEPDPGMTVGYFAYGQLSDAASSSITYPTPINLYSVQGYFTSVHHALSEKLEEMRNQGRIHVINELTACGAAEATGIVL